MSAIDRHQNHSVSAPPTIDLRRHSARLEDEDQFFSSTEIIVKLRQKQFDRIIRRAALIKPLPQPTTKGARNPRLRSTNGRNESGKRSAKGFWLSRRLRDMWPIWGTRGRKAQAWG